MRAVVQRVAWARVSIDGEVVGSIEGPGLCVLVGATHADTEATARNLAGRLWNLRILADEEGRMNRSPAELGAGLLVVSQFTLYGDTSKGRRPSFLAAAPGPVAEPLVELVVDELRRLGAVVATGRFGADMLVELANDGPVTILLEIED
ncbi:MAG TPA: D-aminoacyl-tRNA deacylase [Acidimicrobiales bacterium]|nr:D-aminoacyl-tRNA deacylase [Acidimicrobiales bacterium]